MSPILILFIVVATGLAVGRFAVRGVSLGTSAILFVALVAGHFGMRIPEGFGTLGLSVFVFCVGISAGPTFFRSLTSHGRALAAIGALIVLTGVAVTFVCAKAFGLPAELAGGLMAGAMTSTPALGAITQSVSDPSSVAVGFGVAYPIGILAVVIALQIALKCFGEDSNSTSTGHGETDDDSEDHKIHRRVVRVVNPRVAGNRPSDVHALDQPSCQLSRTRDGNRWRPTPADYRFKIDDEVMLVGSETEIARAAETIGDLLDTNDPVLDGDHERRYIVLTSPRFYGNTLRSLKLRSQHGVTVARIDRQDVEFVPSSSTRLEMGDGLIVVGEPDDLSRFAVTAGHRPRALNETDLLSLVAGIVAGLLLGMVSVQFAGLSVSLGVAGGPLLVGLVLGHFRRLGPVRGSYPPAAMLLMTEGGLALFLADAGVSAGANVVEMLVQRGPGLCIAATLIAVLPLAVGILSARHLAKLSRWKTLGATCGGMTSTPGLAVLSGATDSSEPATSYVAAYPIALVMITIAAPILVGLLK